MSDDAAAAGAVEKIATTTEAATDTGAASRTSGGPAGGTLASGAGDDADKTVTVPADWPADWREKLAGGDEARLRQLKRYSSPDGIWKKTLSLEQRLSSGELRGTFPAEGTDEQKAAWRKESGLPDAAEGYKIELPNGVVLGEADKPLAASFTKAAFDANMTPAQVNGALSWYYSEQDRLAGEREQADEDFRSTSEDALRAEWGAEFGANRNAIKNYLAKMPEGLSARLLNGRLADGSVAGNDPTLLRWLAQEARDADPNGTLVPATAGGGAKGVDARLAEIRQFRRESPDKYDLDKAMQAEELKLLDAQSRMKSRAAA